MLRFYEKELNCHIHIDSSFEQGDIELLRKLFEREFAKWYVECLHIDVLDAAVIETLYEQIFVEKKDVAIYAQRARLLRYLHKIGFQVHAYFQEEKSVIDAHNITTILVGGSADSSQKVLQTVQNAKLDDLTLIIVQHQQADFTARFDQVLQAHTRYTVRYAKDKEKIQKAHIYLAPGNRHLLVDDGYFILSDALKYNFAKPSISLSYDSFSRFFKNSLLIVHECGYLNDGVDKLEMAKENGTKIIVQKPDECQGDAASMVQKALEKKVHDYAFYLDEINDYLDFLSRDFDLDNAIRYLSKMIYKRYGFDFRQYQHETLKRRFGVFMSKFRIHDIKDAIGAVCFEHYHFNNFFLELSINVTEFFRNPLTYEELHRIVATSHKNRKNLKIWSAGCSNGEEPVSIAILLESLHKLQHAHIYATDMSNVVLTEAKNALYPLQSYEKGVENLAQTDLDIALERYFIHNEHFVRVQPFIIKKILYFEHNLATDGSFNEFDIIICSNVMIYFTDELQKRVLQLLYDSLRYGGYLILGEKELLHPDFASKFSRYSYKAPIYMKKA